MTIMTTNKCLVVLLLHLFVALSFSFTTTPRISTTTTSTNLSILYAKQVKRRKKRATRNTIGNRTQSSSGFGGASIAPCPCGSQNGYMKCCGVLHSNAKAYGAATAEQVVRARYSAYAKREVGYIDVTQI
jgi:hypothetical protein